GEHVGNCGPLAAQGHGRADGRVGRPRHGDHRDRRTVVRPDHQGRPRVAGPRAVHQHRVVRRIGSGQVSLTTERDGRRRALQWPAVLWLTVVWCLLWGEFTVGNVLAGVVVAVGVLVLFPLPT